MGAVKKELDNDPYYQKLMEEQDQTWWQEQDLQFQQQEVENDGHDEIRR